MRNKSEAKRGSITGADLRARRLSAFYSQIEAAKKCGLPVDTYRAYEQNKRTIPGSIDIISAGWRK